MARPITGRHVDYYARQFREIDNKMHTVETNPGLTKREKLSLLARLNDQRNRVAEERSREMHGFDSM